MALHTYQNQNAFNVGVAMRDLATGWKCFIILKPGESMVIENDPTKAKLFNPATRQWVPYNTLTDLGAFSNSLAQVDDPDTWPTV